MPTLPHTRVLDCAPTVPACPTPNTFLLSSQRQKAEVAAEATRRLNADLQVTPLNLPLDPSTEDIFGDDFFSGVNGVAAALDTFEARECPASELTLVRGCASPTSDRLSPLPGDYVAARCTHFLKPLLEAGTTGTRGSTGVFIPHVTENYRAPSSDAASEDAPDPVCTVRYIPTTTEHTVQVGGAPEAPAYLAQSSAPAPPPDWPLMVPPPHSGPRVSSTTFSVSLPRPSTATQGKTLDKGVCESRVPNTRRLRAWPQAFPTIRRALSSPEDLVKSQKQPLLQTMRGVLTERPQTWRDCVLWALGHWQLRFHHGITQLLRT